MKILKLLVSDISDFNERILWYAAHSNNMELIHSLNKKDLENSIGYIYESIKCHHNDIANYIKSTIVYKEEDDEENDNFQINAKAFEYYNFLFIPNSMSNEHLLSFSMEYNYYTLFKILLQEGEVDINKEIIFYHVFFYSITIF